MVNSLFSNHLIILSSKTAPLSSSLPKGAREQKENTLYLWEREQLYEHSELTTAGEGHPSSGTMCHLLPQGERKMHFTLHTSLKHKAAFTLAEVLITLGIIGVVAAMTMPTIVANYQSKMFATKLKHAHSLLQNALNLYKAKNNCDNLLCLADTSKTSAQVANELATVVDGAIICKTRDSKYCAPYSIKENSPTYKENGVYAAAYAMGWQGRMYLKNGLIISITQYDACKKTLTTPERDENGNETGGTVSYDVDRCAQIAVDTNGQSLPNQIGVDIMRYDINSEGKLICSHQDLLNNALLYDKVEYTRYNFGDEVK